jgi:hypothetical protein
MNIPDTVTVSTYSTESRKQLEQLSISSLGIVSDQEAQSTIHGRSVRVMRLVVGCCDFGKHRIYAHILRAVSPNVSRKDSTTVRGELCDVSKNMRCDCILNASVQIIRTRRRETMNRMFLLTENFPLEVLARGPSVFDCQRVGDG